MNDPLAMQSANTTGSACSLGEMHGMASCFTNAEGVRCCDFCGNPVTTESDELVERSSFAWTPGASSYKAYPPYVNLTNGKLTVRGTEQRVKTGVDNNGYWKPGETVSVDLPAKVIAEFAAALNAIATPDTDRVAVLERAKRSIILRIAKMERDARVSELTDDEINGLAKAAIEAFDAALSQPLGSQENSHGR